MLTPAQTDRWFTLAELAALDLPGIPNTRRGLAMQADREEWNHEAAEGRLWRPRQGRGGGIEYWIGVLPSFTQAKLLARAKLCARLLEVIDEVTQASELIKDGKYWDAYRATSKIELMASEISLDLHGIDLAAGEGHQP